MLDHRSPDPRVPPAEKARGCRNKRTRAITHHRRREDHGRRLCRERARCTHPILVESKEEIIGSFVVTGNLGCFYI